MANRYADMGLSDIQGAVQDLEGVLFMIEEGDHESAYALCQNAIETLNAIEDDVDD